jgi:hypothetical protein
MSFAIAGQLAHSADAAGCLGYIQNPEDCDIIVTQCFVYTLVKSTGAANLTIGNAATVVAAHDRTDLFAAAAQGAANGNAVVGHAVGNAADTLPKVPKGDYIVAFGSADTAGLDARCFIHYVRVPDYTA